jgi:hypothetical protein
MPVVQVINRPLASVAKRRSVPVIAAVLADAAPTTTCCPVAQSGVLDVVPSLAGLLVTVPVTAVLTVETTATDPVTGNAFDRSFDPAVRGDTSTRVASITLTRCKRQSVVDAGAVWFSTMMQSLYLTVGLIRMRS